jgi:ubiquinone/menaquinone biosynthesis C-methylase UbiE
MKISHTETISNLYADLDSNDNYELHWGYGNRTAAVYWQFRDQIVFPIVSSWLATRKLESIRVLEVGTGHAHELNKYALLNITQAQLSGVDLVIERLNQAKKIYPCMGFAQQNGLQLAFANDSFDIVFQYTCVVHPLTKEKQELMCREMMRVLKPGGIVVWWDLARPSWRLVNMRRLCNFLCGKTSIRGTLSTLWQLIMELSNNDIRNKKLASSVIDYLLPIDQEDIARYFSGSQIVQLKHAGLDYDIWKLLWSRSRALAEYLWRKGWFSQHCFAIVTKGSL